MTLRRRRAYCRDMSAIEGSESAAIAALTAPGDWLTAEQRRAAWLEVRAARTDELDARRRAALSPNAVEGAHAATDELAAPAVEVLHRVTTDPGRLTRSWADEQIATLGEEVYTELVGVAAIAATVDTFHRALGRPEVDIGPATPGTPARLRPDGVGDVGAWVSQTTGPTVANVSRTLSLVPVTNAAWRELVTSHYSRGAEFMNMSWDAALSRPQTELVATRTTGLNECFY